MSISSEINRIENSKQDIRNAIISKGVYVPTSASLDTYDTYINQIENLNYYQFKFTASSWTYNSAIPNSLKKYKKSFSLPSGMNTSSNIVSYIQVPYYSAGFTSNELDACYYWSEIEITSSNIIFYSSSNIDINFSIVVYYK